MAFLKDSGSPVARSRITMDEEASGPDSTVMGPAAARRGSTRLRNRVESCMLHDGTSTGFEEESLEVGMLAGFRGWCCAAAAAGPSSMMAING